MTTRPAAGIRQRRHEAAARALEAHGWQARRQTTTSEQSYHHADRPDADLLVGTGGALYWVKTRTRHIVRQARQNENTEISAALRAARETGGTSAERRR